jgi:hypothetical protein
MKNVLKIQKPIKGLFLIDDDERESFCFVGVGWGDRTAEPPFMAGKVAATSCDLRQLLHLNRLPMTSSLNRCDVPQNLQFRSMAVLGIRLEAIAERNFTDSTIRIVPKSTRCSEFYFTEAGTPSSTVRQQVESRVSYTFDRSRWNWDK